MLQWSGLVSLDFFKMVNEIMELMKQGLLQLMVHTSSETVRVSRVEFELSD